MIEGNKTTTAQFGTKFQVNVFDDDLEYTQGVALVGTDLLHFMIVTDGDEFETSFTARNVDGDVIVRRREAGVGQGNYHCAACQIEWWYREVRGLTTHYSARVAV